MAPREPYYHSGAGDAAWQEAAHQAELPAANYETPIEHFRTPITPKEAFVIRYHLSTITEGNEGREEQATTTLHSFR
jgi:hypothetical protein